MLPSSFPNREPVAKMTAKILFEIDAVHFRPDKPSCLHRVVIHSLGLENMVA